jgi:hypothetical protein
MSMSGGVGLATLDRSPTLLFHTLGRLLDDG